MLEVLKDSTETVRVPIPFTVDGKATAATAAVLKPGEGATLGAFTAASVDALDTVTTAAAARGARFLALAADPAAYPAAVKVSPYVDAGAADFGFSAQVLGKDTGNGLARLDVGLPEAVASGASVVGWNVSRALTAAETDTRGLGLVVFQVTIDGVAYRFTEGLRVVDSKRAAPLTGSELRRLIPRLHMLADPEDPSLDASAEAAYRFVVLPRLAIRGAAADEVRSRELLASLHAMATLYFLHVQRAETSEAYLAQLDLAVNEEADRLVRHPDAFVSPRDDDLAGLNPDRGGRGFFLPRDGSE